MDYQRSEPPRHARNAAYVRSSERWILPPTCESSQLTSVNEDNRARLFFYSLFRYTHKQNEKLGFEGSSKPSFLEFSV